MIPYLPKKISTTAIYLYLGALAAVTILFIRHTMSIEFYALGLVWVVGWQDIPQKALLRNLFLTALGLRWAWTLFAYVYFLYKTGMPFEFSAGDSIWYYEETMGNVHANIADVWRYLFVDSPTISDSGYVFYLSLLSKREIAGLPEVVYRGGSCVVDPHGHYVEGAEPLWDTDGILYAELDMARVAADKWDFDAIGHYARPDVLRLEVNDS